MSYRIRFMPLKGTPRPKPRSSKRIAPRKADIGIICVTQSELRAVKDAMKLLPDFTEERRFEYFSASLPGDGCERRIVMTYTVDSGNVPSAVTAERFISTFQPTLLVLLGMAGSVHEDAHIFDVAISSQIIYYEPRKERPTEVSSRVKRFRSLRS